MKNRYQLIIVGAGPAGSYAALTAAQAGLQVLMLERDHEIGRPLLCAEAVSREGMTRFVEPRPEFIACEIDALSMTVSTGYEFVFGLRDQLGYVLDRPVFDRYLADMAVADGAALQTGSYACGLELGEGEPAAVAIKTNHQTVTVGADYIIAADGVESMIGRMAGLRTALALDQCDASLQYRVSGIEIDPRRLEFFVGSKYSSDGYLWVFPKSKHAANIGLGHNPAQNDNRELRRKLDRFLNERFGHYTIDFECCGLVPKFIGLEILGRDNLLLAGDAARTVDSLTGAGICRALHTGQLAARSVIEACRGSIPRRELVNYYTEAVDRELGRELRFYKTAGEIFRKFDDEDWESLTRFLEKFLSKQKAGSIDPAALVKSVLAGAPRLARLARHLF